MFPNISALDGVQAGEPTPPLAGWCCKLPPSHGVNIIKLGLEAGWLVPVLQW